MKYNNLEEVQKAITEIGAEIGMENILMYNGKGTGYYLVDRMTRLYGNLPLRCKMYRDFETVGDGIYWLMQTPTVIKGEYTAKDIMENKIWKEYATTIVDGQTYLIIDMQEAPEVYTAVKVQAKVNGDYSDAVVFNEI